MVLTGVAVDGVGTNSDVGVGVDIEAAADAKGFGAAGVVDAALKGLADEAPKDGVPFSVDGGAN
jgi:hypothetical protein